MHFLRPVGYWRQEVHNGATAIPERRERRGVALGAAVPDHAAGGRGRGGTICRPSAPRGRWSSSRRDGGWPPGCSRRWPTTCALLRVAVGRDPAPTAVVLDSRTLQATPMRGGRWTTGRSASAGARSPSRWTPAGTCSRCGSRPPMSRTARRSPRRCRRCRRSPPTASRWRLWTRATREQSAAEAARRGVALVVVSETRRRAAATAWGGGAFVRLARQVPAPGATTSAPPLSSRASTSSPSSASCSPGACGQADHVPNLVI